MAEMRLMFCPKCAIPKRSKGINSMKDHLQSVHRWSPKQIRKFYQRPEARIALEPEDSPDGR